MSDDRAYRILRRATLAYARADRALSRIGLYMRLVTEGVLAHALTSAEKTRLGVALYDREHRHYAPETGLFAWESEWFDRRLPAPPARLLIAAAGSGREAMALARRGHRVDCFDPARVMVARCAQAVGAEASHVATFADFCDAVLSSAPEGPDPPLARLAGSRFDAVVIGWGGLSHALSRDDRRRLLCACARVSPRGPILASFILRARPRSRNHSRVRAFATRIGQAVARRRGIAPADDDCDFARSIGFTHALEPSEIAALAAAIGRRVVWEASPAFPHVTFVPS